MIRDFSREELEPVTAERDTEFTLGVGTILGLGGALLLLCGICFALGYTVGHRSSSGQVVATVLPANKSTPSMGSINSKPGAHGSTQTNSAVSDTEAIGSAAQDPSRINTDSISAQDSNTVGDPNVKPALAASTSPEQGSALRVQPATAQVQGWMVQIAAVSRAEDAEVLVSALRKRGYTVAARRELGDNLVHVQTGPFVNRNDANAMRQRLLNDGYNAIIQ